jgi:mono/diheme cytochrome c family protein
VGVLAVLGLLGPLAAAGSVRSQAPASFTGSQVRAGEETYRDVCASCHKIDLGGNFEAPQLAGSDFLSLWGRSPASELFAYIKAAMPPAGRKLDNEALTNIVTYILHRNGMRADGIPFESTEDGVIAPVHPEDAGAVPR